LAGVELVFKDLFVAV